MERNRRFPCSSESEIFWVLSSGYLGVLKLQMYNISEQAGGLAQTAAAFKTICLSGK